MSKLIYLYILDTMAEWEVGNILQAISMESIVMKKTNEFELKTVSISMDPIRTIGGLSISPDCVLDDIDEKNCVALLLPGAEMWKDKRHTRILEKAHEYIKNDVLVGAICGATLALADLGILNKYRHTSNAVDYLTYSSKDYSGKELYVNLPACGDRNLITASAAGGLLWAKQILEYLNVFPTKTINSWYNYFYTGDIKYFLELMPL